MSKWLFVKECDEGEDFAVIAMEQNYTVKQIYKIMKDEDLVFKDFSGEGEEFENRFTAEIIEFGDVDEEFVDFIKNELCDYDMLKSKDLFFICK